MSNKLKDRFGNTLKLLFILFNILMAFWLFSYMGGAGSELNSAKSEVAKALTAIMGTKVTEFILPIWIYGNTILGLSMLSRMLRAKNIKGLFITHFKPLFQRLKFRFAASKPPIRR